MNNLIKMAIFFAFASQASAQGMPREMPLKAQLTTSRGFQNDLGKPVGSQKIDFKSLSEGEQKDRLGREFSKQKKLNLKNDDNQLSAGGHDGNGGDSDAQVAKAIITQTFTKLRSAYGEAITVNETKIPRSQVGMQSGLSDKNLDGVRNNFQFPT